jgi:hypothetical protein
MTRRCAEIHRLCEPKRGTDHDSGTGTHARAGTTDHGAPRDGQLFDFATGGLDPEPEAAGP